MHPGNGSRTICYRSGNGTFQYNFRSTEGKDVTPSYTGVTTASGQRVPSAIKQSAIDKRSRKLGKGSLAPCSSGITNRCRVSTKSILTIGCITCFPVHPSIVESNADVTGVAGLRTAVRNEQLS